MDNDAMNYIKDTLKDIYGCEWELGNGNVGTIEGYLQQETLFFEKYNSQEEFEQIVDKLLNEDVYYDDEYSDQFYINENKSELQKMIKNAVNEAFADRLRRPSMNPITEAKVQRIVNALIHGNIVEIEDTYDRMRSQIFLRDEEIVCKDEDRESTQYVGNPRRDAISKDAIASFVEQICPDYDIRNIKVLSIKPKNH